MISAKSGNYLLIYWNDYIYNEPVRRHFLDWFCHSTMSDLLLVTCGRFGMFLQVYICRVRILFRE